MAGENAINLLKVWYPTGLDVTADHDPCYWPTARWDIWVYLPPVSERTPLQSYLSFRNVAQKERMRFVWRNKNYSDYDFDVDDRLLLFSMKFLGADQFLYDRPDCWPCFWKGIELASTGWNDFRYAFTLKDYNSFLSGLDASTWPPSQLDPDHNCGMPYGIDAVTFNVEAWLFQRVYSPWWGSDFVGAAFGKAFGGPKWDTDVAKTWAACRFWYDTHPFGFTRTMDFRKATPAQYAAPDMGLIIPNMTLPWDFPGKLDAQFLKAPVTAPDGGYTADGYINFTDAATTPIQM